MNGVSLRARLGWLTAPTSADAPDEAPATIGVHRAPVPQLENPYLDTALRLTAIALLLRPMGPWFVRPIVLAAAVLVLIVPKALRQWQVWGVLSILTAIRIAADWPLADNHIYLLGYWLLAVSLALRSGDAARALAPASRALIGLAFAFAVVWKVALSPDFVDGRFFRVTLVSDPRFAAAAQVVGGLSADQLRAAREAMALLPHGAALLNPPPLVEPARLRLFAMASTWGVLLIETLIAVLMLSPTRLFGSLRHVVLLSFCAVTYAFAPVAGFGWLLLVMGLAQVDARQVWIGRLYQVTFVAVLFYDEVPWADLLLQVVHRG